MTDRFFERPILTSPYEYPARHWELDAAGQPTERIVESGRRAELITPIPGPKKRRRGQKALVYDEGQGLSTEAQQYEATPTIINELRARIDRWRELPNLNDWLVTPETARLALKLATGAGKTFMTGLFIKELMLRGDLRRFMVVCPGMLAEQWQDELPHEPNEGLEAARTGNWLAENDLVICRLDKLSRNMKPGEPGSLHEKLLATDWDLVVVDEAHKMSATFFGGEVKMTQRHRLGRLLGGIARHFLLLTATPHNGKEEDFQLFMSLLDADRFEGRFRDGVHVVDVSDLMRRKVKEDLLKFDGTPLFPERRAYTVSYELSDPEAALYHEVTQYVQNEFNRADQLEGGRRNAVGFALTILQRRLASSPEAIYQSLDRRRKRLEERLVDERLQRRGARLAAARTLTDQELEDLDDAPDAEVEALEDEVVDQATASRTIEELEAEIATLKRLVGLAEGVLKSGEDTKWNKLSELLQDNPEMYDEHGRRRKLVLFTEHRDTLAYLARRIRTLLGRDEAVVTIAGGMLREEHRKAQESFTLPWNPNRLEQRFGRIHRIGQTEVCHMWNLMAADTRESIVFQRLLEKVQTESDRLEGKVFDVLGGVFGGGPRPAACSRTTSSPSSSKLSGSSAPPCTSLAATRSPACPPPSEVETAILAPARRCSRPTRPSTSTVRPTHAP